MIIIYDRFTGEIYSIATSDQDPFVLYKNYPGEFRNKLATMAIERNTIPIDLQNYLINGNMLSRRPEQEIRELQMYKRILSPEERLLNQLKPSPEEIQKAQNTIEILTLIQEVM